MNNIYTASEFSSKKDISEVNLLSAPSGLTECTNYWSTSTLGREVLKGWKLRNEKPRCPPLQREYDVVNIDCLKSPCSSHRRRPCVTKPCPEYNTNIHKKSTHTKRKWRRRCPLRIAELAVPSKRHCIDTWRNNYAILPDYMVERLKQQVFDQKPIVQISDAIYCFKRGKHFQRKRHCKKRKLECPRKYCVTDTEALCAIFGHKIALRLNKPMAILLTPRLEMMSDIIACEMTYLLRRKMCLNKAVNQRILKEMAGKISIWVEIILEESNYKLQEDQLCDLEEEFGPILDFVDELMENVLDICTPDSLDYILSYNGESKESVEEEQYGENSSFALSLSEEINTFEESDEVMDEYDKVGTEQEQKSITKEDNVPEEYDIISISSYFRNEIHDLLTNIDKEMESNLDEEYQIDLNIVEHDSLPEDQIPDIDKDQFVDSLESPHETDSAEPISEEVIETKDEIRVHEDIVPEESQTESPQENILEQKENTDEHVEENVGEVPETFPEEPEDDTNKKVKFSDIQTGTGGKLEIHSETRLLDLNSKKEQASPDNMKSNINFAPPNENLLSDADESWPENISSPGLRPSESISRSITSLGKILESEEKHPISSESDDAKKYDEDTDKPKDKRELVELEKIKPEIEKEGIKINKSEKKKKDQDSRSTKKEKPAEQKPRKRSPSRDSSRAPDIRKPSLPKSPKQVKKKDTASVLPKDKNRQSPVKDRRHKIDVGKLEKESPNNVEKPIKMYKPVEKKLTSPPNENIRRKKIDKKVIEGYTPSPKQDYRVNEKTAPLWLQRKRMESRKDKTHELDQYEIRKWCNDLLHEYTRFEKWNNWLNCTCRNFTRMYQTQSTSRRVTLCDYKLWLKLKKNIDKNIATWSKLHRRAHHQLNKTIYICVKVSEQTVDCLESEKRTWESCEQV